MIKFNSIILMMLFLCLGFTQMWAQNGDPIRNCGAMDHLEMILEQHPDVINKQRLIERHTRQFEQQGGAIQDRAAITIPVVVHVIYKTNSENISDAQIQTQLDVLNADFNNAYDFCLASVDPNGNATDGIQRRSTRKRSWGLNDAMKYNSQGGLDAWPRDDYLNIWVCNLSSGYLGYAQFPGGPAATDGVVLDYAYTGTIGTATAPFDLGRTGTHEVGHWLNLRHIWGDGPCSVDDFVSDTPLSDAPNYGCPSGHVSCGSRDMVENYMDYTDDACMSLFTSGQYTRMGALFSNGGARSALLNSNGCGTPGGGGGGASCTDGIQNGNETGVDCGGSCPACPPATCDVPGGTSASNIKSNRARLNWNATSGAIDYTARYRPVGSNNWSSKTTTSTNTNANGLARNTTYEWEVRSNCSGSNSSAWSAACTFTTGQSNSSACSGSRILTGETLELFPNPVQRELSIQLRLPIEESYQIAVYNTLGAEQNIVRINPGDEIERIGTSALADGVYYLRVTTQSGQQFLKTFVVKK